MSWRDDLRRVTLPDGRRLIGASFRGVPFLVEAAERHGGRRTAKHEFPLRDDPYVDDLGRMARVFPVEGYVLGDDYVEQKNNLIEALEDKAGPGELVHPYHGVRRAISGPFTVRESTSEGGIARFSIEFHETPVQAVTPGGAPDFVGIVNLSADAALAALSTDFRNVYDTGGMPSWALASASLALGNMSAGLLEAFGPIVEVTQEMALLTQQLEIIQAQASALVREPGDILDAFQGALGSLTEMVTSLPGAVLQAMSEAYLTDTGPDILETTSTRKRERANQVAIVGVLKGILAIESARLAPRATFDSSDAALDTRDQLVDMLDEQGAVAGDTVYPALVQLRADVIRAIPGDAVLARLVTVERKVAVPSLLLSYQLYGTVAREGEILERNRVRHPGFMSGRLVVLSDE